MLTFAANFPENTSKTGSVRKGGICTYASNYTVYIPSCFCTVETVTTCYFALVIEILFSASVFLIFVIELKL